MENNRIQHIFNDSVAVLNSEKGKHKIASNLTTTLSTAEIKNHIVQHKIASNLRTTLRNTRWHHLVLILIANSSITETQPRAKSNL